MVGDWRKIERGLFESTDGRWRIVNPWRPARPRWVAGEGGAGAMSVYKHPSGKWVATT
jgi:hypothetical protein